jgi:drug/metabolite transporter (DMT)-like permease
VVRTTPDNGGAATGGAAPDSPRGSAAAGTPATPDTSDTAAAGAAAAAAPAVDAPGRARTRLRGYATVLALLLLALVWGYAWVVLKLGLDYAEPFTFAAMRTTMGAVALFILLPILGRSLRPKALGWTTLLGVMQTTGFVALLTWALVQGGAGKTAILTYTMPFWLLLMAWVFLGERLRSFQWVAVGLALCGLVLLLAPWDLKGGWSEVMAIGGALCWAGSAIVAKVLRKRHEVDLLSMTAWQMLLGSVPLIVIALLTWSNSPHWTGTFIAILIYNGILGSALAWILWLYVLNALPAGEAGLASMLTPVVGIVSAWIQLGERPSLTEGLGMIAIVGALLLVTVREIMAKRANPVRSRRESRRGIGHERGGLREGRRS